ncbi:hypothetical protein CR513_35282, partial [Mucuna pruriens]
MMVGTGSTAKVVKIRFTVVNVLTSYNTCFESTSGNRVNNTLMYEIPSWSISESNMHRLACAKEML